MICFVLKIIKVRIREIIRHHLEERVVNLLKCMRIGSKSFVLGHNLRCKLRINVRSFVCDNLTLVQIPQYIKQFSK